MRNQAHKGDRVPPPAPSGPDHHDVISITPAPSRPSARAMIGRMGWTSRAAPRHPAAFPRQPGPGGVTAAAFGRYEVRGEIGDGSMGRVYRGFDPRFGRPVAIKTIKSEN